MFALSFEIRDIFKIKTCLILINPKKLIIDTIVEKDTIIEGLSKYNKGLKIRLSENFSADNPKQLIDVPFEILDTGSSENAIYLHNFSNGNKYYAREIINRIKEDYNADLSSIFQSIYFSKEKLKIDWSHYQTKSIKTIEKELLEILENDEETPPLLALENSLNYYLKRFNNENSFDLKSAFLFVWSVVALNIETLKDGSQLSEIDIYNHLSDELLNNLDLIDESSNEIVHQAHLKELDSVLSELNAKYKITFFKSIFSKYDYSKLFLGDYASGFINELSNELIEAYKTNSEQTLQFLQAYYSESLNKILSIKNGYMNNPLFDYIITELINTEREYKSIYDPTIGTAGTIVSCFNKLNIPNLEVYASEVNQDAYCLAGINFILNDIDIKNLQNTDSALTSLSDSFMGMNYFVEEYDLIICEPPFGTNDPKRLFKDISINFLNKVYNSLSNDGIGYVIVPTGVLNSQHKNTLELRKKIIDNNALDAVINLPQIYDYASVNTSLIVLNKNRANTDKILFADLTSYKLKSKYYDEKLTGFLIELKKVIETHKTGDISSENCVFISTEEVVKNKYQLFSKRYLITKEIENPDIDLTAYIPISELTKTLKIGKRQRASKNANFVPAKQIDTKFLKSLSTNFITGIANQQLYPVSESEILKNNSIVVSQLNITNSAVLKIDDESNYSIKEYLFALEVDTEKIIPEYFVVQLKKELSQQQFNAFGGGTIQKRIPISKFKEIRIQVPSIEEQQQCLVKNQKKDSIEIDKENTDINISISKALRHYVNNQYIPASTSLKQLEGFVDRNILSNNEQLNWQSKTGVNTQHSLRQDFDIVNGFLVDISNIVSNIQNLYKLDNDLKLTKKGLNKALVDTASKYKGEVKTKVVGDVVILPINDFCLSTILENLYSNFHKHGKQGIDKPEVEFEIKKEGDEVTIFYKNNGNPFPKDFKFQDYISLDKTAGKNAGTGLGGVLITKAIQKLGGEIFPIDLHGNTDDKWNVIIKFNIQRNIIV